MSKKQKKPTKKEMLDSIPKLIEEELKKNRVNDMIGGFEVANNMILNYIDSGKTIEEVRAFVHKNTTDARISMKNALEKTNQNKRKKEENK